MMEFEESFKFNFVFQTMFTKKPIYLTENSIINFYSLWKIQWISDKGDSFMLMR
jgi:hypothetical protein